MHRPRYSSACASRSGSRSRACTRPHPVDHPADRSYTLGARHAEIDQLAELASVVSRIELARAGIGDKAIDGSARGQAMAATRPRIVRHNGPVTRAERRHIARINCGPRALYTSFTAAEISGLRGWERDETHVLVPVGTRRPDLSDVVLHRHRAWAALPAPDSRRMHWLPAAVVVAASSFRSVRPAVGILAAAVQQRLCNCADLTAAVTAATRTRHRSALLDGLADIAQGAQALSEIDFARLCRSLRVARAGPSGGSRRAEWSSALPRRGMETRGRANRCRRGGRCAASRAATLVRRSVEAERDRAWRDGGPSVPQLGWSARSRSVVATQLRRALHVDRDAQAAL